MCIENIAIIIDYIIFSFVSYQKIKIRLSLFSITLAKDGVLAVVEGEDFLDLIQPPDNEEPPYYSMFRTFPKVISKGNFPNVKFLKRQLSRFGLGR